MGHRLSKIYTRTGDDGTTGLGDGTRIPKTGARLWAIGDIDELNCCIGLLIADGVREDLGATLLDIQHDLFDLGGELSIPGSEFTGEAAVAKIEAAIDHYNEDLPPLKEFILPGGSRQDAKLPSRACRVPTRGAQHPDPGRKRKAEPPIAHVHQSTVRSPVRGRARHRP